MASRVISPANFARQWIGAINKFEFNVFNFETKAGDEVEKIFRKSFYLHHLNAPGQTSWVPLKESTLSRKGVLPHSILQETGTLENSIKWKLDGGKVQIYTDPNAFSGAKRQYGRNFCYAAIHNEGNDSNMFFNHNAPIPQRQFIGDSEYVKDKLNELSKILFKGLP